MDLFEALYTTRAMRRLKPDPVPSEVIARIVDAGIRAPAPGAVGAQAWRFVVVTDRAVMAELAGVWRAARDAILKQMPNLYADERQASSSEYLHAHFDQVPLLILGYGPEGIGSNTVVQACWSMCLAARAQGLGSTYTTLLTRVAPEVDRILDVSPDAGLRLYAALPMGYPLGRWSVAPRQPAHQVAYADHWGRPPSWTAEPPHFGD
jgi:nitroreductase